MAIQTFNSVDGFSVGNSQTVVIDELANVSANTLTVTSNANISATTASTSKTTGALKIAGGLGVAGTSYNNRSVTQGAYGNIILNEFTGIYNQKDSGTSLIQTTTNALSSGVGIQVVGAAGNGSQLYSTGTMEIAIGVAVRSEDTPTGGTVIASVASTGVSVTGNISATGNITGNYFIGNGSQLTSLAGANVTGTVASATTAGTVTTNAQPNITSVGTLTSLVSSGTANVGQLYITSSSGDEGGEMLLAKPQSNTAIAGTGVSIDIYQDKIRFFENGGTSRGAYIDITATGTGVGTNLLVAGSYGDANVAAYLPTYTGNLVSLTGNVTTTANISGAYILGNGSSLTSLTGANVTGEVSFAATANAVAGANVSGQVANALISGTVYTNAQPNITSVGTLTSLSVTGNISAANITATTAISNSRIVTRVVSTTSGASLTPNGDTTDQYEVTALAVGTTINAPSGTPNDGQRLIIRIDDNGSAQTLAWDAIYRVVGTTLPSTTTASKTLYVGCVYNTNKTKWDVVAVSQEV